MPVARALEEAEADILGELDLVRAALAAAIEAVGRGRGAHTAAVESAHADYRRRHATVHEDVVALIERQGPFSHELRLAIALLKVNDRIDRMSAQCVNIVTLRNVLSHGSAPDPAQLDCLSTMAELTDRQIAEAGRVFTERDLAGVTRLREAGRKISVHNRRCFSLTLAEGPDRSSRKAGNLAMLIARALERVADDAVGIGRQAVFVTTGAWTDR